MDAEEYAKLYDTVLPGALLADELTYPQDARLRVLIDVYFTKATQLVFVIRLPYMIALRITLTHFWNGEAQLAVMQATRCQRMELLFPPLSYQCEAIARGLGDQFTKLITAERVKIGQDAGFNFIKGHQSFNDISAGLDGIFVYVVIESYSAFETLAGDLCITTVDNCHKTVRDNVWDAVVKGEKKALIMELLKESNFNIGQNLGQALKQSECVSFQSAKKIHEAYAALNKTSTDAIFKSTEDIWVAAAVRNILVHNGGYVDDQFLSQLKPFAEFRAMTPGEKLPLTGELLIRIRNATLKASTALYELTSGVIRST